MNTNKWHIAIEQDQYAENPRKTSEHVGTMLCWSRRSFGDKQPTVDPVFAVVDFLDPSPGQLRRAGLKPRTYWCPYAKKHRWESAGETVERWAETHDTRGWEAADDLLSDLGAEALTLSVYEHGNIHFYVGLPTCRWDSGRVGYIICKPGDADASWKRWTPKRRETARKCMEAEVKEYAAYLSGEVYTFSAYSENGEEESCCGLIGYEDLKKSILTEFLPNVAEEDVIWYEDEGRASAQAASERARGEAAEERSRKWFAGEIGGAYQQAGQGELSL